MAGTATDESSVGRSLEGVSDGQQQCRSGEALAELRSSEQVENGIVSTSPPYWDSDDDEDGGPKPSDLYGKYTWKIDKFSQINKRELRSNAFEVGGYKWYILIYPQGCDVCNHLSLFLCVANHDKLLPGWSHFAQFTIAVVNKDPKKSKYSDTLHRFWKKEHDWGWKKFMELSKVLDGFIDADTLIIKAQVQVIRERADRPFRCLDCEYRRELVRVYLTNVEQICRRFVEERRAKLGKLIEDKARWSSFCAFWMGMEQSSRRRMARERTDSILKVVVKHFFIEKEVTSTLVMDSLYSGLKALEGQKNKANYVDCEELPVPIVHMEKDMFVLVDDVLLLLERAAVEPLPPKDEKGPQNRTKDGCSGEDFNKDSIERDERRLTELGRRTIEIFILAHIFSSKIEVAYQEAVALRRQEELIREEEAAWLAGNEQKAKRGTDKEKKSKKKQGKQKRNNRKGKERARYEKSTVMSQDKAEQDSLADVRKDYMTEESEVVLVKLDANDDVSDVSDSVDCNPEVVQPDSEDKDTSPVNWDTDASELHPPTDASSSEVNGLSAVQIGVGERRSTSVMDDSSSTCSTDSVPSIVRNGSCRGNPSFHKNRKSPSRRSEQSKPSFEPTGWSHETSSQASDAVSDLGQLNDGSRNGKTAESGSRPAVQLQDQMKRLKQHDIKKDEEGESPQRKVGAKDETDAERSSADKKTSVRSPPRSPPKSMPSLVDLKAESNIISGDSPVKQSSDSRMQTDESARLLHPAEVAVMSKPGSYKTAAPNPYDMVSSQHVPVVTEKPLPLQMPVMSRPLSAPLIPGSRPAAPVVSMVQTQPLLSRSASAAGRLVPESSVSAHSYVPQSYRNVMMGSSVAGSTVGYTQPHSPSSGVNSAHSYSQSAALLSKPFLRPSSERIEPNANKSSFSFGLGNHEIVSNGQQWMEAPQRDANGNIASEHLSLNDIRNFELYKSVHSRSQDHVPSEFPPGTSGRQTHGALADEFPHLDIINDLLDDEQVIGNAATTSSVFHTYNNGPPHLNRHFSFPGDIGMSSDLEPSTSSCRFERTRSYHDDGFHVRYGSSGGPYDTRGDMAPGADLRPYANGHINGPVPNQWQMPGPDRSFISTRSMEENGYPYHIPDYYSNLACGVNNFTVFRTSNGL